MENYFATQRDNIFRNVEVLIYVFDVESRELDKDMHYYQSCLEAILQNSPEAKIFCLIHKMDLVQEDQRDLVSTRQVFHLVTIQFIPPGSTRFAKGDHRSSTLSVSQSIRR